MANDGLEKDYKIYDSDGEFKPFAYAQRLNDEHSFLTFKDNETIYRYRDGVYKPDGEDVIRSSLVNELKDDYSPHIKKKVCDIVRGLSSIDRDLFGEPPELINVENGVYDIEKGELRDHGPDKLFLSKIPVEYDSGASTEPIKSFVHEIVHESDVKLVQELFGYLLYRDYSLNKAFMLLGDGSNGKTTLTNVMETFLGVDNVANESLQDLIGDPHAKARLHSKLLNVDADISDNELKKTGPFKKLTGKDSISAHRKYEKAFNFENYAKLVFAANNLPRTRDTSLGFFRRWIIIDFPYTFTDNPEDGNKDKDPDKIDELTSDKALSGILNWALEGLERLLDNEEFSTSGSAGETKNKWIMQSDTLAAFVDQCVETVPGERIECQKFFEYYSRFCQDNGMTPHDDRTVGKRLQKLVPKAHKKRKMTNGDRTYYYLNIAVDMHEENGMFDSDSLSDRGLLVKDAVERLDDGSGVTVGEVCEEVDFDGVEDVINDLKQNGVLWSPKPDRVKSL